MSTPHHKPEKAQPVAQYSDIVSDGGLDPRNNFDAPPPRQPEQDNNEREKEIADLRASRDFYKRRVEALQQWQSKMRDPERTIVCDIIANGHTLEPAGDRYTPPRQPLTPEQLAKEVEAELTHYWAGEYIDTSGARDQLTAFAIKINAAPPRQPLTDEQKLNLVTSWFAEDWSIKKALGLLHDYNYESAHGITQRKPLNWEPIQEFWRNNSNIDWNELERAVEQAHGIESNL